MKLEGNSIRPGNVIRHKNALWSVVKVQHVKPGKGGAFAQTELRNVLDGSKLNERFRSAETVERVHVEAKPHSYLFHDDTSVTLMDTQSYEQIVLPISLLGNKIPLLQANITLHVNIFDNIPVSLEFPSHISLKVAETEPVVKGQTAQNSFKPATLDNGLRISVPPFVRAGETVVIDANDLSYVKRAES